jgi:Tfp pilus assembly protein FimV
MNQPDTDRSTRLSFRHGVLLILVGLWSAACLAVTPADQAVKPRSYKPKNGESLDHVIAQTMADSPLKIELLRQAFINLNPTAFEPAKGKTPSLRLRKGVSLTVPDSEQLLQAVVPPKAELASSLQSANSALDIAIERKRWVHFP